MTEPVDALEYTLEVEVAVKSRDHERLMDNSSLLKQVCFAEKKKEFEQRTRMCVFSPSARRKKAKSEKKRKADRGFEPLRPKSGTC